MHTIVGVRFKEAGKVYSFDPNALELAQGDWVIVETAQGKECGEVMQAPREVPDDQLATPLKPVLRRATEDDLRVVRERADKERHALEVCEEKVRLHNLEMKLVNVEYSFDGSKIIFYFTADGRVDFRALVRDLAAVFRTRIELRQIGVRDEVKMLGGLGPCGREACCKAFLTDFSPVSIRMAKDQNLSLNPTKISGLCGRLMCCLNYEQNHYAETLKRSPKRGTLVMTPEGPATVVEALIVKEKLKVRLRGDEPEFREYALEEITETNEGGIAEWESSGGRARATLAKAAYIQNLNRAKNKEEEFPDYSTDRFVTPSQPAAEPAEQPVAPESTVAAPAATPNAADDETRRAVDAIIRAEKEKRAQERRQSQPARPAAPVKPAPVEPGDEDDDGEEAETTQPDSGADPQAPAKRRRRRGGRRHRGGNRGGGGAPGGAPGPSGGGAPAPQQ